MEGQVSGADALADFGGVMFNIGHALTAARDHHIRNACLHHHCRVDDCLQSRAAATVKLVTRHLFGKACQQPRPVRNARCLAIAIALGEDDIINT